MDNVGIDFNNIEWKKWDKPGAVGRVKMVFCNGKRVRILELPAGFNEEKWCEIGHQGYVLSGVFTIMFEDSSYECKPGMGFVIPDGVKHRSKGLDNDKTVVFVVDEIGVDNIYGENK
ncbi:cupin domain-containing protein [Ruminiclostridium herbifermentans]|uniref:Cupin domain-containing protein n=1 Tax=Ruminiclostridium herbifermentans TaxID=2488810 RepID=A0A4U7JHT4_9FIRM|nr:cupin domain-containing protein [Ruminiclostridium herbifermentans]QNU66261.1 cupin domain-containing protein [Ruminiclostridium herbifermentans]